MKIKTAGWVAGDNGFARLLQIPKYGRANTVGVRHQQPKPLIARLDLITGGNSAAVSAMLAMKVWSQSDGTPRLSLSTNTPLPDGLEVYVEETSTYWVLVVRHVQPGDVVALELVAPSVSGFAEPFSNETYTYVPTGHLIKPQAANTRRTLSNPTTSGWVKLATIKTIADFTRYGALISVMDVEAPTGNSAVNLFSFQVNHQTASGAVTVALIEQTERPHKTFELHYVTSTTGSVGTTELWAKADLANSTLAVSMLSEAAFSVSRQPSAQWHDRGAWTTTAPTGAVKAKSAVVEAGLTFSNSWAAFSGYTAARSSGIVISGRMAFLNATLTGGTMTDNTLVATVPAAWVPSNTVDLTVLVSDAAGAHTLGRASVYNDGKIVLRGPITANTKVTFQAFWPLGAF